LLKKMYGKRKQEKTNHHPSTFVFGQNHHP